MRNANGINRILAGEGLFKGMKNGGLQEWVIEANEWL